MGMMWEKLLAQSEATKVTREFCGNTGSTANASSYTFTNHSIGTAAADRYVVVCVFASNSGNGTFSIDSVTVGGASTTSLLHISGTSSNGNIVGMFITNSPVTSGTTASIVCTMNAAVIHCSVGVYAVYGLTSTTPNDTISISNSADPSSTIDQQNGGVVIAMARDAFAYTVTWSGVTEDYDAQLESRVYSGGSIETTASGTLTVTANFSTNTIYQHMLVASWWRT